MITLAELVIRSAAARQETRGHHRRLDFPETLPDSQVRHTSVQLAGGQPQWQALPLRRRQAGPQELSHVA